jgi:hypothetical protein
MNDVAICSIFISKVEKRIQGNLRKSTPRIVWDNSWFIFISVFRSGINKFVIFLRNLSIIRECLMDFIKFRAGSCEWQPVFEIASVYCFRSSSKSLVPNGVLSLFLKNRASEFALPLCMFFYKSFPIYGNSRLLLPFSRVVDAITNQINLILLVFAKLFE